MPPRQVIDYLALVGDSADGFPGLAGWGAKSAATVLARWGSIDKVLDHVSERLDPEYMNSFYCAFLAFTLNTAAYQAEILRGAIQSVPKGQWEGAAALGLPRWYAFLRIILPQALIVALRPYGNEIILMVKGSAIVAIVTVYDLMGETRRAFSRTFDYQMYLWAGVFYLVMVETLRRVWERLEASLTKHLKRSD